MLICTILSYMGVVSFKSIVFGVGCYICNRNICYFELILCTNMLHKCHIPVTLCSSTYRSVVKKNILLA